jgi:uncharacterized delta-60 repeat protein
MFFSPWLRKRSKNPMTRRPAPRRPRRATARPALELLEDRCVPSAGQLDPTFGMGGIVNTNIGGTTPTFAQAVVVTQTDGKVVVVGSNYTSNYGASQIAVVRYNPDGSLDSTFGSGGEVFFHFNALSSSDAPGAVALDASGHIVVAGSTNTYNVQEFAVARLNNDGSFDSSFGSGGKAILPRFFQGSPYFEYDYASSVALDASGHIVLAGGALGYHSGGYNNQFAVARLNADGSLDSSFGSGGETTVSSFTGGSYSYESDYAARVALDASGHVIVAGTASGFLSGSYSGSFAVTRLNSDGSLDNSFGSGGKAIVPHFSTGGGDYDNALGLALDTSGRLVLAGSASDYVSGYGYTHRFAVARLNANGSLDSSFGSGGQTTVSFSTGGYDNSNAVGLALDASGRLVVAGTAYGYSDGSRFAVTRLNGDGSLDSSFGSGGKTTISYGSYSYVVGVALDASGRVVVAGTYYPDTAAVASIAVTRLGSNGSLDASWGSGGRVTTAIPGGTSSDYATNMTITQPDGKIIVVGTSYGPGPTFTPRLAVARYNSDGSLDGTFGSGGKAVFDNVSGLFLSPSAVSVDGSGHILVAGSSAVFAYNPSNFAVVRLNSDGSPDTTFGSGGRAILPHFSTGSYYEYDSVSGVALDAGGHVVLAGSASGNFSGGYGSRFAVARLNADGSLDSSFGSGGETTISFGGGSYISDEASGVALDASGRIVVAGDSYDVTRYTGRHFAVTRLNADGSLDGNFGSGGKTIITIFSTGFEYDKAAGVALDPSGRIVVAGTTGFYYGNTVAVARLNAADGSLDQSFGTGGESTVSNFGDSASQIAIDAVGRIAVVGRSYNGLAVALFKANGCPDVDFGLEGKVTTLPPGGVFSSIYNNATGAAFDSAGRLVVAGTFYSYSDPLHGNFAVVRYLPHDPVIEAGSATFAGDLQAAVTALRTTPPAGTPRLVIHVASSSQMAAVGPALNNLSVNPSGPEIEVLLDVDPGSYSLGSVSVPAGLKLILDGDDSACGTRTLTGTGAAALTVASGDVLIRAGMAFTASGTADLVVQGGQVNVQNASFTESGNASAIVVQGGQVNVQNASFTESGNASAIVVQGGQLTMRNSTVTETTTTNQAAIAITGGQVDLGASYSDPGNNTINITVPGHLIRLTGANDVMAVGDTFVVYGTYVYLPDNYQIEDLIDHSMDGLGGGTVFWVPNNVFVSTAVGSVQRGVNVVPAGGTVNVQAGVKGTYYVGSKLLTLAYDNGLTITQQADTLDATRHELLVSDVNTTGSNSIKFVAGTNPGEVQLNVNNLLQATFLPTGRLVDYAGYGDDVQVDSAVTLSAWLYGSGNDRLKGGGGNNVLIGSGGGDLLVGGSARDLIIGTGADRLVSNGGQDILIAGSTSYNSNEVALAALMAEWTSSDSLATRIADLTGDTASPYFTGGLNGSYFLLGSGPNQTVYSDYSANTITAGSGPDLIFASASDKVTGLTAADVAFILS